MGLHYVCSEYVHHAKLMGACIIIVHRACTLNTGDAQ
jgi:hypothetical protein